MDDGLDDLFGDGPSLQLPEPIPKGLLQRVDELSLSGCCQKLVWSNSGCVAYISPGGRGVVLRHLLCDHNDGRWVMSKEYPIEDLSAAHSHNPLVHLAWSPMGNELAVVDIYGRISIYCSVSLPSINRLTPIRRFASDPEDNLSAVVGLMWLHNDRPSIFHKPMHKAADGWSFKMIPQRHLGPRNPYQPRPAVIFITRGGTIRVLFQVHEGGKWQDFKTDIENFASPSELLTHATMCAEKVVEKTHPDKESALLLAAYNSDRELRIYRVSLDFGHLRVTLQHLKVLNHCLPMNEISERCSADHNTLLSHAQLSHLEFIPPGPRGSENKEWTYPLIFASFAYVCDNFRGPLAQTVQKTVLCKWQLQRTSPKIHPTFESLSSKKSSASSAVDPLAGYVLKRSSDVSVFRTLLSVQQVNVGSVLAMTYSDGVVEFRDRATMDLLPQDDENRISSLGQIGFNFPATGPCLHAVISPNACAMVSLDEQHSASLKLIQMENGYANGLFDDSFLEIAHEAFVRQYVVACMNGNPSDDCLATMQAFMTQFLEHHFHQGSDPSLAANSNFSLHFLSEFWRILGFPIDYSVETRHGQVLQNTYLQRLLSAQAALGYAGEFKNRSLPAVVAYTMLNLRFIAVNFATALKSNPKESELYKPDTIHLLMGMASWSISLFIFIVDEIFMLSDLLEDPGLSANNIGLDLLNRKVSEATSPALSLLLISSSRGFLKFICASMKLCLQNAIKVQNGRPDLALAYRELEAVFQKSPVTVTQFENLLSQLEAGIKSVYQLGTSETDRTLTEKDMLIKAEIPALLLGPVKELLTTTAKALKEEVNVAEIYFTNIGWLGLTDDQSSKRWQMRHPMDAMRKVELRKDRGMKRCTRCGAVTEDMQPQKGANLMILQLQRHCLCGSWWMGVGEEEVGRNGNGF